MKYKDIKKNSPVDVFQNNLFLAITDMYWDMIIQSDYEVKEARKIIIRDVNDIIDETLRQEKEDDIQ